MEEFVYYNNLYDIYGNLLTEKEQEAFHDYYQEDLSLSEIADNKNISRSAVQKMIKNVLEKLNYYEENLNIYKKNCQLSEVLKMDKIEDIKAKIEKIISE